MHTHNLGVSKHMHEQILFFTYSRISILTIDIQIQMFMHTHVHIYMHIFIA